MTFAHRPVPTGPHAPKTDWTLLWTVLKKHLASILIMFGMGLLFLAAGVVPICVSREFGVILFGSVFALAGLGLIGLAVGTNLSSVQYYYGNALLKKHGVNATAVVTGKELELEPTPRKRTELGDDRRSPQEERLLTVSFAFDWQGQRHESAFMPTSQALYDAITIGQTLPIRFLPWKPEVATARLRLLKQQLKQKLASAPPEPDGVSIPEPILPDDDEA